MQLYRMFFSHLLLTELGHWYVNKSWITIDCVDKRVGKKVEQELKKIVYKSRPIVHQNNTNALEKIIPLCLPTLWPYPHSLTGSR
jgi:hypothetical protein